MPLRILLLALVLSAAFLALRSLILLRNTEALIARSDTFSRDYFLGPDAGTPFTYLALGDSTAAGVGVDSLDQTYPYLVASALAARGNRVHVLNRAVSGAKVANLNRNQLPGLNSLRPDVVTVSIGANDANHSTPDSQYEDDYRVMLNALQAQPSSTRILLSDTVDMSLPQAYPLPWRWNAGRHSVTQNAISARLTAGSQVKTVSLFNDGRLVYSLDHSLYASDLFHPSAKGYAKWAALYTSKL